MQAPSAPLAARLALLVLLLSPSASAAADLFVNGDDPFCLDEAPCFASIQEAIEQAEPGDHVQIQPGVYHERLRVRGMNAFAGAGPADRIVIGRAEGAPVDSVILDGAGVRGGCWMGAVDVAGSAYVSVRGLVITGFEGPAVRVRDGRGGSRAIHVEANRIFGNGSPACGGGIVVEGGSSETLVANNLVHANRGSGIVLLRGSSRGRGLGGPHHLIQNTVHGNEENGVVVSWALSVTLANNAITGNGAARYERHGGAHRGYGVVRYASRHPMASQLSTRNNLLCGNTRGEVSGFVFVGDHAGNLTPTGTEAPGVLASPECLSASGVYEAPDGVDGVAGTLDDDFTPTRPGPQGMPSPAIDRGVDPRTLGLGADLDPRLLADFAAADARPVQRDVNRPLDFDVGALELPCPCFETCESCRIEIHEDGSSTDACLDDYDTATQCCDRRTGTVSSKELGRAYDVCPATRSQRPGFDSEGNADGCSAVPDRPFPLCPEVRFGCDEDAGEANCPEGIDLPCNGHDFCYQTCGRTKAQCDNAFYLDMIAVCDAMTPLQKIVCYDDCVVTAGIYFDGVFVGAQSAYENGQNRSCQCCQDVYPPVPDAAGSVLLRLLRPSR